MKKYLSLILVLLFVGLIPIGCISCWIDSCGCGDSNGGRDYLIAGFETYLSDNLGGNKLEGGEFYDFDELTLALRTKTVKEIGATYGPSSLSFSNPVYACSPIFPEPRNDLKHITFIALENSVYLDAADSIHIGDTLNNRFLAKKHYLSSFTSIDTFLLHKNIYNKSETFLFQVKDQPKSALELKFKLEVVMTDSLKFTYDNLSLKVK